MKSIYRNIEKIFTSVQVNEGDGAKVRRIIGVSDLRKFDPFLMLDHGTAKLPVGFPDHPHRGFCTVSYGIKGTMCHQDFKGHSGILNAGDCQWMTAGRGIVHAEMPLSWEEESEGFQLWINLPLKDKMCEPNYQEIKKEKIPIVEKDNATIKVIAGESSGVKGPITSLTPTFYLDVNMRENGKYEQLIPKDWNALCYIYEGSAFFGAEEREAKKNQVVVLKREDIETLIVKTQSNNAKFLVIAGQPLEEPIFQYGPFVMGSEEDLEKAFEDYHNEKNGFEGAKTFVSKIGDFGKKKYSKEQIEKVMASISSSK